MADIVTNSRAVMNATLLALNSASPSLLAELIKAASSRIRRECRREFSLSSYSEYYSGGGFPYQVLMLREFPVTAISRLATSPQDAVEIQNTDSTTNQRATVASTPTGMTLLRVASGVTTTSVLAYSANPTVESLAAAVVALGAGWDARVLGDYGKWPSSDIRPSQGAYDCRGSRVSLDMLSEDVGEPWKLDADAGILHGSFPQGKMNIRVDYSAGWSSIPEDIQEACVQTAADMYLASTHDANLTSVSIGPYSKSIAAGGGVGLSSKVRGLISQYIAHDRVAGAGS